MVCPMRFLLVAASAAVALLSTLASLMGWSKGGGRYDDGSDESEESSSSSEGEEGGENADGTPSPREQRRRRRRGRRTTTKEKQTAEGQPTRSASQLAGMGLWALWDAFTGKYLARRSRELWRAAASSRSRSRSESPPKQRRSTRRRNSLGSSKGE